MNIFKNKKILLIICGGIAAYKSLEIIRLLKKKDAQVKTILTKNANKFVTPLSVVSLSQEKVYSDLFDHKNESEMDHISLSRWSDLILIAPATANTISKIAFGIADDLASTAVLASNKKIFLAPAMNVRMWEHPSNKDNINKIRNIGYEIIGPEIGDMACGEYGEGKMTEPEAIITYIEKYFKNIKNNKKFKALVTAGPTLEYIDPVRYITNKSSGKQGYAIAKSLKDNGFETTLISGPTNLDQIPGINTIRVNSAKEMLEATNKNLPADVAIFSAAVADYKVNKIETEKIKKKDNLNLTLEKNVDILGHISKHNSLRPKLVIGFAAETDNIVANAKNKRDKKGCDWLLANDVSSESGTLGGSKNTIHFINDSGIEAWPEMTKKEVAETLSEKIIRCFNE